MVQLPPALLMPRQRQRGPGVLNMEVKHTHVCLMHLHTYLQDVHEAVSSNGNGSLSGSDWPPGLREMVALKLSTDESTKFPTHAFGQGARDC